MLRHEMDDQRCSSHAQSPVCQSIRLLGRISEVISRGESYTNLMLSGSPVALRSKQADADRGLVLFGEQEGRIAHANIGRDLLYLFVALQRHLGYPSVPKSVVNDDNERLPKALEVRLQKIEQKLKILEMETKGGLDLSRFYKPVAVQFLWLVFLTTEAQRAATCSVGTVGLTRSREGD